MHGSSKCAQKQGCDIGVGEQDRMFQSILELPFFSFSFHVRFKHLAIHGDDGSVSSEDFMNS